MKLIECGDHGKAPGGVICTHLAQGTSKLWHAVRSGDVNEGDMDWICPLCYLRFNELTVDDLITSCMHCVRRLQSRPGNRISKPIVLPPRRSA
jgi:hypothetical protein